MSKREKLCCLYLIQIIFQNSLVPVIIMCVYCVSMQSLVDVLIHAHDSVIYCSGLSPLGFRRLFTFCIILVFGED